MEFSWNADATASFRLDGQVAVVTGAAGGIGAAIAKRMVQLGAAVALLDLKLALLQPLQEELAGAGATCLALACDVADESAVIEAERRVRAHFGHTDILVNNAGVLAPPSAFQDVSADAWDHTMAVNLRSVYLCSRVFGAAMLERRSGNIVNMASIAGSSPTATPQYSVSKAGVLAITRHTAVEWGPRGIRSNAVSPGFIRTPLTESHYAQPELLARRTSMIPVQRLGTTADIADAVCFLASAASLFVNGQEMIVDGGFLQTTLNNAQAAAPKYGATL
jgi:NAD(P)-dependent dehydrogenase (short-subunit alcohol dehydrogenase family)